MRASNLNPVLEQLNFKIPLQMDLPSITVWLDALNPELACQACGKILRLLKSLPMQNLSPDVEFKMLGKLREVLEVSALKLEKPFLDAGNPVSETEQINAELVVFSYAELAKRFWHVAEHIGGQLEPEKKPQFIAAALFQSMEALRRALFVVSLLYDRPYEGFWRLCYAIYRRAELLNILEIPTNANAGAISCIDNSFKNLLVFYLSDTRLLTQREMKSLHHLFDHRQVVAKVYTAIPENKGDLLFGFDLGSDASPARVPQMESREGSLRYISTIKIARSVCRYLKGKNDKQDGLESGNYALFLKIAKVLSMQESRKFSRVTEKRAGSGLIGFNNIASFLVQRNTVVSGTLTAQALTVAGDIDVSKWNVPQLSLVPMGEEEFYRMASSKNKKSSDQGKLQPFFSDRPADVDLVESGYIGNGRTDRKESAPLFEKIEIIDSSAKDYGVLLKSPKNPVKIGDLFGLLNSQNDRVELGLVRRISSSQAQEIELGVELVTLKAEAAIIWQSAKVLQPQAVVFLPRIPIVQQRDSIIYPRQSVSIGETVVLQLGGNKVRCKICKLLHSTAVFSLAELALAEIV